MFGAELLSPSGQADVQTLAIMLQGAAGGHQQRSSEPWPSSLVLPWLSPQPSGSGDQNLNT